MKHITLMGSDQNLPEPEKQLSESAEKVKEHFAAIIPSQILEKIVDKPLRIPGVAVTAGMSRNFIYTPEGLQAFAAKLIKLVGMLLQTDSAFSGRRFAASYGCVTKSKK